MSALSKISRNEWLQNYQGDSSVLVADSHSARRASIVQTLLSLGLSADRLQVAENFDVAWKKVAQLRPIILITELGGDVRNASDLVSRQRAYQFDREKDSTSIVISNGFCETSRAHQMQTRFDLILEWPIAAEDLSILLSEVVLKKGKKIGSKDLSAAQRQVHQAIEQLDFLRKVAYGLSRDAQTQAKLIESFNQLLSESNERQDAIIEAYELGKRGFGRFSQFVDRLPDLLKLAIRTQNYDDIEQFYEAYKRIERRTEHLTETVVAALLIGADHYLRVGQKSRAMTYHRAAAVSSGNRRAVLREIITRWIEVSGTIEARDFLGRFATRDRKTPEYLALDYLIYDVEHTIGESLTRGFELFSMGIRDPLIFQVLVLRLAQAGKRDSAEHFYHQARKLWPDQTSLFQLPPVATS